MDTEKKHPNKLKRSILIMCLGVLMIVIIGTMFPKGINRYKKAFYFDRFIYQKSMEHGYFPANKEYSSKDYGARAADINALRNAMQAFRSSPGSESPDASWLRSEAEGKYVVILVGDSHIWGMGLLNEERFAHLLNAKLNEIRPTRVFSFANCGDNLMENYQKYEAASRIFPNIDVVVFGVVRNDLLVNSPPARYDEEGLQKILDLCSEGPTLKIHRQQQIRKTKH